MRVDHSGWAYAVDRTKDMIISGGENISSAEAEVALNSLSGIVETAVVAAPDERWGEVGLAFIVSNAEHNWDQGAVREALLPKLAAYKIPKYVRKVAELPKTATGKVRKQDLRPPAHGGIPHDDNR